LNKEHFSAIVRHGAFADLTVCITEFCKVSKYQKISLLAIAMLRGIVPVMLECPECQWPSDPSSYTMDKHMIRFWYPVLFAFYDIIMNGEDLEVRRLYVCLAICLSKVDIFPQSFGLSLYHTQDLRTIVPPRILGHGLQGTFVPDIRCS
jgi:Sec7-like guanine-nucleotide exchange factor